MDHGTEQDTETPTQPSDSTSPCARGTTSNAIASIAYAVNNDIKVSNNSWGGEAYSEALYDAIEASQSIGHIFVASAGNYGANLDDPDDEPHYPAGFDLPNIISVAATNNDDGLSMFTCGTSCYGPTSVDLGAPGSVIYSTELGDAYRYLNGTSMATPHVTGVVALVLSRRPDWAGQQVKDLVLAGVRPIDALIGRTVTGGVVNAGILVDCNGNNVADETDIAGATSVDCSGNGIPDECERDCNENGAADSCDILEGTSDDCNSNGIPDDCEPDCNGNGVSDYCDLSDGTTPDCNENWVPDECDISSGVDPDCNYNDVPDSCDLAEGTSTDCDEDGVPDECVHSEDCNENGTWDGCDLFWRLSPDCDENDVPDECLSPAEDCNGNWIPDACESDCNDNQVPDDCDIAAGTSADCTGNDVPDECEPDCNENGLADSCDLAEGTSVDLNGNDIPDECDVIVFVDAAAGGTNTGASWADAYTDLQDALTLAGEPANGVTEVWVAAGTYTPAPPDGDREATFELLSGVAIYGGFPEDGSDFDQRDPTANVTILSGDLNGNDLPRESYASDCCVEHDSPGCDDAACQAAVCAENSGCCEVGGLGWHSSCIVAAADVCCDLCGYRQNVCDNSNHVVMSRDADTSAVLDGFRITSGNAVQGYAWGGGVDSEDLDGNLHGGGFTLRNCVVMDNFAISGGGVSAWRADPTIIMSNCTFRGNRALSSGGALRAYRGNLILRDCRFIANSARLFGGAISLSSTDVSATNTSFYGNTTLASGGAIYYDNTSNVTLINGIFSGNSAESYGGAVYHLKSSALTLTNCTFTGNNAGENGGALAGADGEFDNCIFWENTDENGTTESSQIYGGEPAINFSCVSDWSGALGGWGNFGFDPCLTDADGEDDIPGTEDDDLRLISNSPCIDSGNNAVVPLSATTDLEGYLRFIDIPWKGNLGNATPARPAMVDLGPYEHGLDCNWNGINDEDDIAQGYSQDCNDNSIPDECEPDCNGNGVPDDCDIADGTSTDLDENGVPDECDTDCQPNGVPDAYDVSAGSSEDCQPNGVPDECEVPPINPEGADCNENGVPDNCETDCQPNGTPDDCDIRDGISLDCQPNGAPDECELESGAAKDCNSNYVPDECDVSEGTSPDTNDNGIPDECMEPPRGLADMEGKKKNRYVSFDPHNTERVALQVELISSTYFPDSAGVLGWVGEPDESAVSRIVEDAYFTDFWPAAVHLADCEIVPAAEYAIRAAVDESTFTDALSVPTTAQPTPKYWGDVVGEKFAIWWTPPNGVVNMDDIMAAVQRFQKLEDAPPHDLGGRRPRGAQRSPELHGHLPDRPGLQGRAVPVPQPRGLPVARAEAVPADHFRRDARRVDREHSPGAGDLSTGPGVRMVRSLDGFGFCVSPGSRPLPLDQEG